jgi:hypothetical protein
MPPKLRRASLSGPETQEYRIMISRTSLLPIALLTLGGTGLASASTYDEGQWVTTFLAGGTFLPQGSFTPHIQASDDALGTTTIDHLQFRDAFKTGPSFGVEAGYMTESNFEPFARLSYTQLQGRTTTMGNITSPALDSPAAEIAARFDDMDSWQLNVGTRYFLTDSGPVRTYVAGYLGADRIDALRARVGVTNLADASREIFMPQQTRRDAGVEGGVSWQLSDQADLRLSLGAQYVDARHARTNAFAPVGVSEVSFTEPRWSVPVDLGVNFRF